MSKRVGKNSPMRCGDPCSPRTGRCWGCGWRDRTTGEREDESEEFAGITRKQCKSESGRPRRCAAGTHAARAPEGAGDVVGARGGDGTADGGAVSRTLENGGQR